MATYKFERRLNRAQASLEYALLAALIIAALVGMQVYIKRSVAGKIKDSTDQVSGGNLFSANSSNYQYSFNSSSVSHDIVLPDGGSTSNLDEPEMKRFNSSDDFSGVQLHDEELF